jgi:D-alanyl-D-alanine carboxypeptidase/D-alanyl-D-alanine-endopeptidase (penicillin-binding protein 4)
LAASAATAADWRAQVKALAGGGAVLAVDENGREIIAHNADKPLIPASTLKILTAAAALEVLGPDYRFPTDFYLTADQDLYVVGRGDPHLVSEELARAAQALKDRGLTEVRTLHLDNSYFTPDLIFDGNEGTLNPYDAYTGALCVNFNTIYARIDRQGRAASAEAQTPLTDLAARLARESGVRGRKIRFNISENPDTCLLYAGELLEAFLKKKGVAVKNGVKPAASTPQNAQPFLRYQSQTRLAELIAKLFKYSNNFIANQVFLTLGAREYGPPADPAKSRKVIQDFLKQHKIEPFHVEEGSGLSRKTKVTARRMMEILKVFEPHRDLLDKDGPVWAKTGTLKGVRSLAGYLQPAQGPPKRFVILLNGPQAAPQNRARIVDLLEKHML